MKFKILAGSLAGAVALMSFGVATASAAVAVSCTGTPTASNITWSVASTGGVSPVNYLWSNGSTSTAQTVAYAPGTYAMGITATDASSTVATSTCSATVAVPTISLPSVTSFTATPGTITAGQSTVLSWVVANASSTSVSGVGAVLGNSVTVTPAITTTYTISAVNGFGTTTATAVVTVGATSSTPVPPAPTTVPLFRKSALSINDEGQFSARGMTVVSANAGTVGTTTTAGGSFTAKVFGMTFVINSVTPVTVGDYVDVKGTIDASGNVNARFVRSFPATKIVYPKMKKEKEERREERRGERGEGRGQQFAPGLNMTAPGLMMNGEMRKVKNEKQRERKND